MPIPVGRSGNVDGEGGTADGAVRPGPVAGAGGMDAVPHDYRVRVGVEPSSVQPIWTVRRVGPTLTILMALQVEGLPASPVALKIELDELSHHDYGYGADGS